MTTPEITLIIPMYNENTIIRDTANTLHKYMSEHFSTYEIIFSDDGSTDGCGETVLNMQIPFARVLRYEQNRGKGFAVRSAMLEAKGEIVMFTDADLAYGTDVIRKAYDTLYENESASVLIGSRNLMKGGYEGYTAIRRVASKLYIRLLGFIGGFRLSDSQCGCKAYKAEAAKNIFSLCKVDRFAFDFESIIWAQALGYRICELPVKVINHRDSSVHIVRDSLKMLKDIISIRKRVKREYKELGITKK
ncbi:MAG: glycosyltransferase [Clostridia bacterium]|nr:glycosyltransferase [Clostridia bacterium]